MKKVNVVIVIGTRPEAIKMAPVYLQLRQRSDVAVRLVATGQHLEMLDQVFDVFNIRPDRNLAVMRTGQTLAKLTARILVSVQEVLDEWKPDVVLVHGDTATCLSSALAAFYTHVSVGHVEAGLRTHDFEAPWPEEMNRRLVDPISRWCFAPTDRAAENLRREGICEENIFVTGNTAIDALLMARDMARDNAPRIPALVDKALDGGKLILVTGHRRENFGEPFEQLCLALRDIVEAFPDCAIVYPVHLNPHVQEPVHRILGGQDRIFLIPPVEYLSFIYLFERCHLVLTDSGGIQEEAPSLRKPVLVMRNTTERPEAVEHGLAKLVGTSREEIVRETSRLMCDADAYQQMSRGTNPYGDGKASSRIVDILLESWRRELT